MGKKQKQRKDDEGTGSYDSRGESGDHARGVEGAESRRHKEQMGREKSRPRD